MNITEPCSVLALPPDFAEPFCPLVSYFPLVNPSIVLSHRYGRIKRNLQERSRITMANLKNHIAFYKHYGDLSHTGHANFCFLFPIDMVESRGTSRREVVSQWLIWKTTLCTMNTTEVLTSKTHSSSLWEWKIYRFDCYFIELQFITDKHLIPVVPRNIEYFFEYIRGSVEYWTDSVEY